MPYVPDVLCAPDFPHVDQGWDGKANKGSETAQIDTYTWKVDLTDVFGKNHKYIGRVTIIR